MAQDAGDDAARAGFNNPFSEDESQVQPPQSPDSEISPQRTRSIAEETALEEDVAPTDTGASTAQSPGGGRTSRTTDQSEQAPAAAPRIAFKGTGTASKDPIERLSTHKPSSSSNSAPGNENDEEMGHIRTVASKVADKLHLSNVRVTGPSRFFNPTNVRARVKWGSDTHDETSASGRRGTDYDLLWRARDNRKGRGSIAVRSQAFDEPLKRTKSVRQQKAIAHLQNFLDILKRMLTTFPYWDMAFWSGWSYTIGSALFVMDGAFAWAPAAFPDSEFKDEDTYGVPLCFFFGAIFFQIGATMAYFEAINDGSFHGSAMRRLMEGHEEDQKKMLDEKIHAFFGTFKPHHHKDEDEEAAEKLAQEVDPEAGWRTKDRRERPGSIYPPAKHPGRRRGAMDMGAEEGQGSTYLEWRWWPSWHALRTHHAYEIGYLACAIQLFGVTLYGVTSVIILPGILDSFSPTQELAGYWIPQMVAAACFLIASIMFTFETQEKWWKPEFRVLGWWIGFWSIVGSVGFELCAAFGPASGNHHWALYQSNLSSMWGSGAYLIGSVLQWYEALNKHPVQEMFDEPGELKTWQIHPL